MRKIYIGLLFVGFSLAGIEVSGQNQNIGIGTQSPDASAILDIQSNSKGLLVPRLTEKQKVDISSPANGLLIYQTDSKSGFYYFDENKWKSLSHSEAKSVAVANPDNWSLTGNAGTTTANFIGTTDSNPLEFRVNNLRYGYLSPVRTTFGNQAGVALTSGLYNLALGEYALFSASTASYNVALGSNSLELNNGNWNVGIGYRALGQNTEGAYNVGIGGNALFANTTGISNMALGVNALYTNVSGSENTAVGVNALNGSLGSGNIGIGNEAGMNKNGGGSVFIGNRAGKSNTLTSESNVLYIANSSTEMPLIYGDFSAKYVTIGDVTPALRTQGTATGGYNLLVKGGILTEKVKVALAQTGTDWADYVFEPSYELMPLEEVEEFVIKNKHLPKVPSAEKMIENGLDMAQTSKMFMEKIEELTLYLIELNKEVKALKVENDALKAQTK